MMDNNNEDNILLLESFYGGSHKQLLDLLESEFSHCFKIVMKDKKWHWRMRTSALYFAETIPENHHFRTLFISSVTNLAELVGLRPDLAKVKKILYFHENQLVYPVRKQQDRDFQYGYNQIVSCIAADQVLFNSYFNMESFINSINSFLNIMPDYHLKNVAEKVRSKSFVLYFPVFRTIESISDTHPSKDIRIGPLHIVWAHRWEHDKNPELLFESLLKLKSDHCTFKISVIGQAYTDVPDVFETSKARLREEIVSWGYQETKEDYFKVLRQADVAVSTADHEFFGVSMMESVACGCYPLCPNKLVYPEFYPGEYLYNTPAQLVKKLRYFCKNPGFVRHHQVQVDVKRLSWDVLRKDYEMALVSDCASGH